MTKINVKTLGVMTGACLCHDYAFSFLFSNLNLQFEVLVRAIVFCNVPKQFKDLVNNFYSQAFQAYQSMNKKGNKPMDTSGMVSAVTVTEVFTT